MATKSPCAARQTQAVARAQAIELREDTLISKYTARSIIREVVEDECKSFGPTNPEMLFADLIESFEEAVQHIAMTAATTLLIDRNHRTILIGASS
jgi:hypothetical protein